MHEGKIRKTGFTLIEMMAVVALIGILAAIAMPSYEGYLVQARRSMAQAFVAQVALKEEEYFTHMREYTATLGSGGLGLSAPRETADHYGYAVCRLATDAACSSLPDFPSGGYVVVAARLAGSRQMSDPVGEIVFYSTGRKCTTAGTTSGWGNRRC